MSTYTIENFWKRRLTLSAVHSDKFAKGWEILSNGLPTFKEAPLSLSLELSASDDPFKSPILLVSAPGAVGKSTLARQIAAGTGAIYVDLAKADPVGGNTISGGLVKSDVYQHWQNGGTALLIDGLDEARLRVTQEAFSAFLMDIAELCKDREIPTALFGRTGAVQEAWLALHGTTSSTAVLEIGYYDHESALEFADTQVRSIRGASAHASVDRTAVQLLLERLRTETDVDGGRFAGYAPVLQAVAERVAREPNPAVLVAQVQQGEQPVTLQVVVSSILDRERNKLSTLRFEDESLLKRLYLPDEQLDRLAARIYSVPPPNLPQMRASDAQKYSTALDSWVGEHPFLDGGQKPSSAVFGAVVAARALKAQATANIALQHELRRGTSANPFLSEFYLEGRTAGEKQTIPPEHIGIVYASLRARLSLGDVASLLVEGADDTLDEEALRAEVEITLSRRGAEKTFSLNFETEQTGLLRLGTYVEDVDVSVPHGSVEIGPGPEILLVAPINIQCEKLFFDADKLIVECPPNLEESAVYLESSTGDGIQLRSTAIVRDRASFAVAWPGAMAHPWTNFSTVASPQENPKLDEALRRFRKFVTAFRSHSKGNLARYQHKLEHARMTKGSGGAVLALLMAEKILKLVGPMYYLDPDLLGAVTGATYADCMARRFNAKTVEFVSRAVS